MSEAQITFFLNTVFSLIYLWVIMYVNNKYILKALLNSKRFKLFALRDKLNMMVMEGNLTESSSEYKFLRDLINFYIRETEDFEVVTFLRSLLAHQREISSEKNIENVENYSQELRKMFYNTDLILREIFAKRVLWTIKIISFVLRMSLKILHYSMAIEKIIGDLNELVSIRKNLAIVSINVRS